MGLNPQYLNAGGAAPKRAVETSVKVIGVSRANNVSIMLTQFAAFEGGPCALRAVLLAGERLGIERVSLLLQVCTNNVTNPLMLLGNGGEKVLILLWY